MNTKIGGFTVPSQTTRRVDDASTERRPKQFPQTGFSSRCAFERGGRRVGPDTNKDGRLDDAELAKMAEHLSARSGQTITADDLKAKLDSDGDGNVTAKELQAAMPPPGRRPPSDMPSPDLDGDGVLGDDELSEMAQRVSEATGEEVTADQLRAQLDADADGAVTMNELEAKRSEMKDELASRLQAARLRR